MKEIQLEAVTKINRDGTVETETKTFPYGIPTKENLGRPITKRFAQELIERHQNKNANEYDIVAVTFHKTSILQLLSQPGCVGLNYYYGMKEDGKETIVLSGVDSEGNDLGIPSPGRGLKGSIIFDKYPDIECAMLMEVAGGNIKGQDGLIPDSPN